MIFYMKLQNMYDLTDIRPAVLDKQSHTHWTLTAE